MPDARNVGKLVRRAARAVMKSHRLSLPRHDLPIRFRPWFLLFTFVVMLVLALLGFTDFSRSLPLNDKFLHLTCFCVATGVFYFIFDVDEDARRIWFWRHASLIFTAVVCFVLGGLVSEIVQSMLPYKQFDFGDVVANIVGSAIGLYTSYHIEKHHRSRREIARLYRPLHTDDPSDAEDSSDGDAGPSATQFLPLFTSPSARSSANLSKAKTLQADRLADVWDEREELFWIGDDSESEDTPASRLLSHASLSPRAGPVPMITITPS